MPPVGVDGWVWESATGEMQLGCPGIPYRLSAYIYIEAREATACIEVEEGVWINNNTVIIINNKQTLNFIFAFVT